MKTDAQGNVQSLIDYKPYGTQTLGTSPNGPGYTGHISDDDTGLVYMQARYYDPEAARFLSVDPNTPSAGNIFNFNRASYANNNPVANIDADGRVVTSLNASNNGALQKLINGNAAGQFSFNKDNQLEKTGSANNLNGSNYYSDDLVAAINSPTTVILDIAPTATLENGNVFDVDVSGGGGITEPRSNGNLNVTISGNANTSLKDITGAPLSDSPGDILMHEIVGHVVPIAVKSDTGNAVANENKARAQISGSGQRAAEPEHVEGKSVAVTQCGLLCTK